MKSGIVKWFNNSKGFGFIIPEDGGADIFAHYSSIEMDGYKTLRAGQPVTFETINGPKGLHATNIQQNTKQPTDTQAGSVVANSPPIPTLE
jgi:CspA family cold shock protein